MKTLAIALVLTAAAMQAQDWNKLRDLRPDQKISVLTHDGTWAGGRFLSWSPDRIEMQSGKKLRQFTLADTSRVSVVSKGSRWKSALIGAAIGFAALFPCGAASAGYVADTNNPSFGTRVGVGTATGIFGAGIGAGIGALVGGSKQTLVYKKNKR